MNDSEHVGEVFGKPGAKAAFRKLKDERWVASMRRCGDPILRRLGTRLLVEELLDRLEPDRAEALNRDIELEALRDFGLGPRRGRPPGKGSWSTGNYGLCACCNDSVSVKKDGSSRAHPKAGPRRPGSGMPGR